MASLLLSGLYPLFRFSRLTFAEHREKPGDPPESCVRPTAYAESTEALRDIKVSTAEFAHSVALMRTCRGYDKEDMSHGVTNAYKRDMAYCCDVRPTNWPLPPKDGRLHPCVPLNLGYQRFFRDHFAKSKHG